MIPKLEEYKTRFQMTSDPSIKPGLEAIETALEKLGNPQKSLKIIHVSGTNGKGSTIQFMEAILRAHGYTTGTFTSPAIHDLHDQIRMNGEAATKASIDDAFQEIKNAGQSGKLTDFELLTVVAFLVLKKGSPDYVLIETGMGGLLDSTNVVNPIVSVITSIALDHTQFLGESIEEIARHKAGIIKEKTPVIIGQLPTEALDVVQQVVNEKKSSLKIYGTDFIIEKNTVETFKGMNTFNFKERKMKGPHQRINTAVAIEALLAAGIELKEEKVEKALKTAQLPHRFEEVLPNVFLDGAHNPAAARALRETIETEFPGEKVDFVIGMLKRKDLKGTLDELLPIAHSFTFLTFHHPEAASGEELMRNCHHSHKKVEKVSNRSIILSKGENKRKIIAGSLYLLMELDLDIEN